VAESFGQSGSRSFRPATAAIADAASAGSRRAESTSRVESRSPNHSIHEPPTIKTSPAIHKPGIPLTVESDCVAQFHNVTATPTMMKPHNTTRTHNGANGQRPFTCA
jgi:hypothetical protein